MKRVPPRAKTKSKSKGPQTATIRAMRGKYKHLDLMKGLVEMRRDDRQRD